MMEPALGDTVSVSEVGAWWSSIATERSRERSRSQVPLMVLRVLIVDDHELVRRGLSELVDAENDMLVVGQAGTVVDARGLVAGTRADVALLDVRLPDGNGIELCRELRSADPSLACLMLTSFDHDEALLSAVIAGASGYLLKQVRGGTGIVDAVRRAGGGGSLFGPDMRSRMVDRLRVATQAASSTPSLDGQGERMLELIFDGSTNAQIAAALSITEQRVANYISSLLVMVGMRR